VAINIDDARIPDNAGHQPVDQSVVRDAPAAYFSTLPIKAMVRHLRDAGIPASVSNTAGTFVCNHVFYALMHRLSRRAAPGVRGGFIHIPALPQQAARQPGMASMALDHRCRAFVLPSYGDDGEQDCRKTQVSCIEKKPWAAAPLRRCAVS
jgi:pyroglutamyl-peptidase